MKCPSEPGNCLNDVRFRSSRECDTKEELRRRDSSRREPASLAYLNSMLHASFVNTVFDLEQRFWMSTTVVASGHSNRMTRPVNLDPKKHACIWYRPRANVCRKIFLTSRDHELQTTPISCGQIIEPGDSALVAPSLIQQLVQHDLRWPAWCYHAELRHTYKLGHKLSTSGHPTTAKAWSKNLRSGIQTKDASRGIHGQIRG